ARSREVRLCHSSWEADEQSGPDRSGAGGAKGGGQGEREPAKHAPDTVPGTRVTGAGARTASARSGREVTRGPTAIQGHVWTAPTGQGIFWLFACGRVQVMCPACLRGAHDRWP